MFSCSSGRSKRICGKLVVFLSLGCGVVFLAWLFVTLLLE